MKQKRHFFIALILLMGSLECLEAQGFEQLVPEDVRSLSEHQALPRSWNSGTQLVGNPNLSAKTNALTSILLGSAGNIFGGVHAINNCMHVNDSTGLMAFIHRNNPTFLGGTNLDLRYDISTNGGQTWIRDIGVINPTGASGHYPQIVGFDTAGSTSPQAGRAIWLSDHFDGNNWKGFNVGATRWATFGVPNTQDMILPTSEHSIGGGIAQGRRGEYWAARFSASGTTTTDSLLIYKGVYNPGTFSIQWTLHNFQIIPWSRSFDGNPHVLAPSVAFSPDGNIGWIATLGDLSNGADSILNPILIKSTDGGATWGSPTEVDINSFAWVHDSLQALWVDFQQNPISTGRGTGTFEYDLNVDGNGNAHVFFVIASAGTTSSPLPEYTVFPDLSKYAVDLFSSNQGASFDLRLVAPILTFRTPTFGSTATTVFMDNFPQISRTHDGTHIFYSWVDSDTSIFTGSGSGIGFGMSDNIAPNLWMAGLRITDGNFTCIRPLTQGDLIWDSRALFPHLAPEVIVNGTGLNSWYRLPITLTEMQSGEPTDPVNYQYIGTDAIINESHFAFNPGSTVTWNGCGVNPGVAARITGKVYADMNTNGAFDSNDIALPNQMVTAIGNVIGGQTGIQGNYQIKCDPNLTYTLGVNSLNPAFWTLTTPAVPYVLTPIPSSINAGYDFAYQPVANNLTDLAVTLVIPSVRPGFPTSGIIYVQNLGTGPAAGTLTMRYDTMAMLQAASPTWASNNSATLEATWNIPTIDPFQVLPIQVTFNISPSAQLGSTLGFVSEVAAQGQDQYPYNDLDASDVLVVGSLDPNDKSASPAGTGNNHEVAPGTELSYRIRFQNVGTAPATILVIRDTLDTDLDLSTLKMLGASHAYTLDIQGSRFLTWDFPGINLPDSNTNEPASHGYIDFSIRPKANLPLGTVVDNSAAIYFDFNAPVITNVASITYDIPAGVDPGVTAGSSLRIYPHPVGSRATIAYERTGSRPWTLEITDLQGRTVFREAQITTSEYEFDRATIPAGLYLYKVTQAGLSPMVGRMVLQ